MDCHASNREVKRLDAAIERMVIGVYAQTVALLSGQDTSRRGSRRPQVQRNG
jgi:hypothetical protein